MNEILDLTTDIDRDIIVTSNRTLKDRLRADVYESGSFLYPFDFTGYTGSTLEVRISPKATTKILAFSTEDGSIVLDTDGVFYLIKSAEEMNVRSGEYFYDMYLSSLEEPKRAFMRGKFIIEESLTK